MVLGGARTLVLGIVLLRALDLHVVARRSTVLDAITDVDVGVDVLVDIVRQGLIDLLVDIVVAASIAWWMR